MENKLWNLRLVLFNLHNLPGLKRTLLEVKLQNPIFGDVLLFEPNRLDLEMIGLKAPDVLLSIRPNGHIHVPVENHNSISARLEPGVFIGSASCVSEPSFNSNTAREEKEAISSANIDCVSTETSSKPERTEKLLRILLA